MASQDQFVAVQEWLQSLYGEGNVPDFEINSETISTLYELASASQRNTLQARIILDDSKIQTESYRQKNAECSSLISSIGLPSFSESSKNSSQTISAFDDPEKHVLLELVKLSGALSSTLELATTDASAVMEAIGELDIQLFTVNSEQSGLNQRKAQLTSMYKETSEMRQMLQRVTEEWDGQLDGGPASNQERVQNLKYLEMKAKEYSSSLETLKDTLKRNGAQPSLYHGTLQQLHEQLQELNSKNSEKQIQLEGFKQLPPDATLAKLKIEEAAAYLLKLEEQIALSVSNMQLHSDL